MTTYRDAALRLYENGYAPIPIRPGTKRPAVSDWTRTPDRSQVEKWVRNGMGECGVGLLGGEVVVIDIDVTDRSLVKALIKKARTIDPQRPPLVRQGRPPKVALLFQTDTPFSRIDSRYYGQGQHIEARGLDTQTVAYGIHPDTQSEYKWLTDRTPLNTDISELPRITPDDIADLFEYFDTLAEQADLPLQAENTGLVADHDGAWMRPKYEISDDDLWDALTHIDADDYHRWVTVGMALFHQYDGDDTGLSMWDDWSATSEKYRPGDCAAKWRSFHAAGRRRTATVGTVIHLAQAEGWHNPGIRQPQTDVSDAVNAVDSADDYANFIDLAISTSPPPIQWLVDEFIPANKVCLLIAPGGSGKSLLTLQLAFSVSTGTRFVGHYDVHTPGRVLVLGAEDDEDDLHRRIHAIWSHFETENGFDEEVVESARQAVITGFLPLSMVGKAVQLVERTGTGHQMTELVDKIITKLQSMPDVRLLVIDPLSRYGCGEEGPDFIRLVETLEYIRGKTGVTILAVHHANKAAMREGGADQQYAARGHSALTDGVRFQMNMATLHPDDAPEHGLRPDDAGLYVRLAVSKTNYTAPGAGVWLRRGEGGVLSAVNLEAMKREKEGEVTNELKTHIISLIIRRTRQGDPISRRQLLRDYAGKDGELRATRARINDAIDLLMDEGRIVSVKAKGRRGGGGEVLEVIGLQDVDDEKLDLLV